MPVKRRNHTLPAGAVIGLLAFVLSLAGACSRQEEGATAGPPTTPAAQPAQPGAAAEDVTWGGDQDEWEENELGAWIEAEPESGDAPLAVRFSIDSTSPEVDDMGSIGAKYRWDFGDGSAPSHSASPTHTYAKPGEYTATVKVRDGAGRMGWDWTDVSVDPPGTSERVLEERLRMVQKETSVPPTPAATAP